MAEQIKSAIQYGNDYYKDLISACCDISDRHKDYIKMANNSLNAWEEVLTELEVRAKEYSNKMENTKDESDKDFFNGQSLAYFDAHAFIKQKLKGVTENDNSRANTDC